MIDIKKCFDKLIGLRGLCQTGNNLESSFWTDQPKSGLFFDDLPGISSNSAALLADGQSLKGVDWIRKKYHFALQMLVQEFTSTILPQAGYDWNFETSCTEIGDFVGAYFEPQSNNLLSEFLPIPLVIEPLGRGLKIVFPLNSSPKRVILKKLRVLTLNNRLDAGIILTDGSYTKRFSIDLQARQISELLLDYQPQTSIVYLQWENDDFEVNNSILKTENCNEVRNELSYKIWGWDGLTTSENSTFGMSIEMIAGCDEGALFCQLSHRLAPILLYRTGIEMMLDRISSERFNYLTLDIEGAERLLTAWQKTYQQKLQYFIQLLPTFINSSNAYENECLNCRNNSTLWWNP